MTQFHTDEFRQARDVRIKVTKNITPKARWALRLAMLPVVPLLPLLAMMTGIAALKSINNDASLTGTGRARLALVLGFVFTGVQAFFGWQAWQFVQAAQHGPQAVIASGQQGDVDAFLAHFDDAGTELNPTFAAVFLDVINDRYGTCGETSLELPDKWYMSWRPFEPFEYAAQFEQAIMPVTAQFVVTPDLTTWMWQPKLRYVVIHDAEHGDLRFPPGPDGLEQMAAHPGND